MPHTDSASDIKTVSSQSAFERWTATYLPKIALLPIYFLFLYTLGSPGFDKIFRSGEFLPKYEAMFADTFLATFPGTDFSIYLLGMLELLGATLFGVSLLRGEFLPGKSKTILHWAFFVGSVVFASLGFGMRIASSMDSNKTASAAQLFYYLAFTVILWALVPYFDKKFSNTLGAQ